MKIRELMTRDVVAVEPGTTLKEVASLLLEHRISGLPVIDAERRVLGVVSEADILVKERGADRELPRVLGWLLGGGAAAEERIEARTAGEAMSLPAITTGERTAVHEAARLMTEHGIKRLPVVGDGGALVGIVTRRDLVRAFARSDDEIVREIEEMVLTTLWIEDEGLRIDVLNGEVRLSGTLERRSDAELLPRFVSRVPGVVAVRSTLRWRWDDRKKEAANELPLPAGMRTR
jgi:CBS domain-containing protein